MAPLDVATPDVQAAPSLVSNDAPVKGVAEPPAADIIEIRQDTAEISLREEIFKGLRADAEGGEKTLPTLLLYDEEGLKLFERITYLDEYYPTNAEIEVLTKYATQIADRVCDNTVLVELGSGNLRKVNLVLNALEAQKKHVDYYALDLDLRELQRTLTAASVLDHHYVKCHGLHGTYDDGLAWLQRTEIVARPKGVLWLGSSVGNFERPAAAQFLASYAGALGPQDWMLIGVDECKDPERVYHAYNDRDGVTKQFTLNGLQHANRILGGPYFAADVWDAIGEYLYDGQGGRHQAFVSPNADVRIDDILIRKGERIRIEESHKYSQLAIDRLFEVSGFTEGARWANQNGDYALHMVSSPVFNWSTRPEVYASHAIPTLEQWQHIWTAWDMVSKDMIPDDGLLTKPIKLRNACIFYLGHIPTFLDVHLTRATGIKLTEPAHYRDIFERGIDPDVDNPEQCHAHSKVPDAWPKVADILEYEKNVRQRVKGLYQDPSAVSSPKVSRALWLGYEHEMMHLETLLYMLVQTHKTLPPPGVVRPDFEALAEQAQQQAVPNTWTTIPATTVQIGLDDSTDTPDHFYGWDIERPSRTAEVPSFQSKARAITNEEYAVYLYKQGIEKLPASWQDETTNNETLANGDAGAQVNGQGDEPVRLDSADLTVPAQYLNGKFVRTVFGPVPLAQALHWPVAASYDELLGCAIWFGGRIPTMEEVRSIYQYAQVVGKEAPKSLYKTIPAVNSHLVNNGVEESPPDEVGSPANPGAVPRLDPSGHFTDVTTGNVGFKHWHPVAVSQKGERLCGQGDFGGLWEWTSTALDRHAGYEPMELYPGYSADFFDGKHNVVLGGSWATHPRLAGRKSFINWYQHNYLYVWAGARIVRDL